MESAIDAFARYQYSRTGLNPAAVQKTTSGNQAQRYIGLMSGTSLDGIDAVLAEINSVGKCELVASAYLAYPQYIRIRLLNLHDPQFDEIHLAALVANELACLYSDAVHMLLAQNAQDKAGIHAIGCHGQTLRHRPEAGYTIQMGNAAKLAELAGITVVSDFRSRDIAAGGQGAPLVPAFHAHALRHQSIHRVIVNIGGIANLTDLPPTGPVRGWDTGPGNMLMDAWVHRHSGSRYDKSGVWGASGEVNDTLLLTLLSHAFLHIPPPKSAGREQFNLEYLQAALTTLSATIKPADVQATLLEFTAQSLCQSIKQECPNAQEVYVCGGGIHNDALINRIKMGLTSVPVYSTGDLGIDPDWMEALAFAWLARQTMHQLPSNLPEATGARGSRILGAIHPA